MTSRRSGQDNRFARPPISGAPTLRTPPALRHVGSDPVGPLEIARPVKRPASCAMTGRREASRGIPGPRGSRRAAVDRPLAGDGDIRLRDLIESVPGGWLFTHAPRPGRRDEGPRRGGRGMRWGFRREAAPLPTTSKSRARQGQGPPRPAMGPPCPDRRQDRDRRLLTPPPPKGGVKWRGFRGLKPGPL